MEAPEPRWLARLRAWRETDPEVQRLKMAEASGDELGIRLAILAETCPSATGSCGCAGQPPRSCGREDRPSLVGFADCLACVTLEWWREKLEPF